MDHDQEYMNEIREAVGSTTELKFFDHVLSLEELMVESAGCTMNQRCLYMVDDLSHEAAAGEVTRDCFTKMSSHNSVDIFLTTHSLSACAVGRHFNLIFNNANVFVLFKTWDALSLSRISGRLFPGKQNFIARALNSCIELFGCYAHILIDASTGNPLNHKFAIRSNIFSLARSYGSKKRKHEEEEDDDPGESEEETDEGPEPAGGQEAEGLFVLLKNP